MKLKMNATARDQWLKFLRSGEYTQDTKKLRTARGFCCLGVLCDVHSKATNTPWVETPTSAEYLGSAIKLPEAIVEDYFLRYGKWSDFYHFQENLTSFNDDAGWSFEEIANWIEVNTEPA